MAGMNVPEIMKALRRPETLGGRKRPQREVAEELGISQSTVSKWENGTQSPNFIESQKLRTVAIARGILAEPNRSPSTLRSVDIVGAVGLGEEIEWYAQGDGVSLELVELPFPVPEGCFALEARGTSMHPRVKNGEIVIARQNGVTADDLIGHEVVLKVVDGPFLLKTLRRGYAPGLFNLESHNGPMREDEQIEWVAEIWAIIPSRRWVKLGR